MAAYRIPSDVIVDILICLPVKSLLRFKSVCKYWRTLIDSPLFIQLHLNKSLVSNFRHNHTLFYANYDSLYVVDDIYQPSKPIDVFWPKDIRRNRGYLRTVGSCNGLVCLCVTRDKDYYSNVMCFIICNPSTRTLKFKPLSFSEFKCLGGKNLSCWFGYDGEHGDYKIVVTRAYLKENVRNGDVHIYSFKADSWKCITHTTVRNGDVYIYSLTQSYYQTLIVDKRVVCANNMLHYIVSSLVDDYNDDSNDIIARFDLSSETWMDNDLSFPHVLKVWTYIELGVLDDCLYLCLAEKRSPHHNVWVMKGYRDGDYSWSIMYNIPGYFHNLTLFAPLKEGQGPLRLLFVYEDSHYGINGDYTTHRVLWYNPDVGSTETFKVKLEQSSSSDSFLRLSITSSLVSIPGSSFDYIERPGND